MNELALDTALPRKDRERLARYHAIMIAAQEVFAEKGYAEATLEQIAERAEFGKGTIYNYFRDKRDLFYQQLEYSLQEFKEIAATVAREEGSVRDRIIRLARRVVQLCLDRRAFIRILIMEKGKLLLHLDPARRKHIIGRFDEITQVVAEVIAEGVASGELRPLNNFRVALLILQLLQTIIDSHLFRDLDSVSEEDLMILDTMIFKGLNLPAPGIIEG